MGGNISLNKEQEEDPFEYLRNKARSDELLGEAIDYFMARETDTGAGEGLTQQQSRRLAMSSIDKLLQAGISCEAFTDVNFQTGFRLYNANGTVPSD